MKITLLNKQRPWSLGRFARCSATLLLLLALGVGAYAQDKTVRGTVLSPEGEPVAGASVMAVGTSTGVMTDAEGNFSITLPESASGKLEIQSEYKTQTVDVSNQSEVKVSLEESSKRLDELVVVGYGTQKRVNMTGSVAAIGGKDLVTTKNQNVQNMLTGKVSGVRVIQKTSEPGSFENQFDIRGFGNPLIVIDGVPRGNMQRMDPNDIESISVLKDASAAIYGVEAANGVVLITTKKGEKGRARVEYNMYWGFQTPADIQQPVDAVERMTLFNERYMRRQKTIGSNTTMFSDARFAPFLSGEQQSTDWYKEVMRSTAPQQSHNLSVSGATDKVDYYLSFGYSDQKGFFTSDALSYDRFNVRSNVSVQAARDIKLTMRLGGIMDNREGNSKDTWEVFKNTWRSAPDDPVYANNNPDYYMEPTNGTEDNPAALISTDATGFKQRGKKIFQSNFEADYSVYRVKGLKFKALFSYDTNVDDETHWNKPYQFYRYDESNDSYRGKTRHAPMKLRRTYNTGYSTLWNARATYDNSFAGHNVSALVLYEERHGEGDNIYAQRNFTQPIPYLYAGDDALQEGSADRGGLTESARRALVGRLNYDYEGRYLVETAFRYDGSNKFPANSRWGFFPSVSAGWRISEEKFIKDNLELVDNLKLRASYGILGDDGAADFQFLTGYDYPAGGDMYANKEGYNGPPSGYVFGDAFINSLGFRAMPNPEITWYTSRTANIGVDADFWKGLLGVSVDVFQRDRKGLLAHRDVTLPGNFGSDMPQENINSDRTKGIEIELRHHHRIGEFRYGASGQLSFTRSMTVYYETKRAKNSYHYWQDKKFDRWNDIWFLYGEGGRYTSWEQIVNSMYSDPQATLPGDYYYEDWNGDGSITDEDKHPLAVTTDPSKTNFSDKRNYPLVNFGISLNGSWKGIDLNLMFQGSAMTYIGHGEQLAKPLSFEGNALSYHMDRWRPADPKAQPFDPATQWVQGHYAYGSGDGAAKDDSRFAIQNCSYLRLKTAELGYTLPKSWLAPVGVKSLRLYFSAYNLLTFTGIYGGIDPERPTELMGYMYPLNKTFNFGANLTF